PSGPTRPPSSTCSSRWDSRLSSSSLPLAGCLGNRSDLPRRWRIAHRFGGRPSPEAEDDLLLTLLLDPCSPGAQEVSTGQVSDEPPFILHDREMPDVPHDLGSNPSRHPFCDFLAAFREATGRSSGAR